MLATAGRPSRCKRPKLRSSAAQLAAAQRAAGGAERTGCFSSNLALKSPSPAALLKGQRSPPSAGAIAQTCNKTALPEALPLPLSNSPQMAGRHFSSWEVAAAFADSAQFLRGRKISQATSILQMGELMYSAAASQGAGDRSRTPITLHRSLGCQEGKATSFRNRRRKNTPICFYMYNFSPMIYEYMYK